MNEAEWREKAQTAEASLNTLKQAYEPAIERVKLFKANFGIKESSDGSITIDYEKFVERLGPEGWLALRAVGDEHWKVTGSPGDKPRMTV